MVNYWTRLSFQIIAIFSVAMIASFISDQMHGIMGDQYHCIPGRCCEMYRENEPHWHWGWRHFLWCYMGVALFVVQAFRVGVFIHNNNKQSE